MRTLRFSVAEEDAGTRLDKALAAREEIGSRSLAERLLRDGSVRVDGERPAEEPPTRGGLRRLRRASRARRPACSRQSPCRCRSCTRTSTFSSSTSRPGSSCIRAQACEEATLVGQLLSLGAAGGPDPERPGVVHRLDRDTSGLLVAARSEAAYGALQEAITTSRGRTPLSRARPRLAAVADGSDRRADRPRPSRSRRGARSTPTSRARPSRTSRSSS